MAKSDQTKKTTKKKPVSTPKTTTKKPKKISSKKPAAKKSEKRRSTPKEETDGLVENLVNSIAGVVKRAKQSGVATEKDPKSQHAQVRKWLYGSRSKKTASLTWRDDTEIDQYEGREGTDILVVLCPYQGNYTPPKRLVKKAQATWTKIVKGAKNTKLRRDLPLVVEPPPEKSGLILYNATVNGLPHLSGSGSLVYQFVAKDVGDAKGKIAEFVARARLQVADGLLRKLSPYLKRPPEAVLQSSLQAAMDAIRDEPPNELGDSGLKLRVHAAESSS